MVVRPHGILAMDDARSRRRPRLLKLPEQLPDLPPVRLPLVLRVCYTAILCPVPREFAQVRGQANSERHQVLVGQPGEAVISKVHVG